MATMSIRIPDSLHRGIKEIATKDGYSMNQFLISAAAEKLSALGTIDYLRERAARADPEELERVLALVPDVPPDPGDELPKGYNGDEQGVADQCPARRESDSK